MATIQKETSGYYTAIWRSSKGRCSCSTGEFIEERAWKKAARLEAESQFWEYHQDGIWKRLADACFSPRYLHAIFMGRSHIMFPRFRALLREADVKIQPAAKWRDRARPKNESKTGRRWEWRGRKRTLSELLEHADQSLSPAAVRFRLTSGWKIDEALSRPLMSRAESGLIGANKVNQRARKP
jgi:hypothetical protein